MSTTDFAVALVAAAAVLAVWLDMRFDARRPDSPTARVIHAMAAYVALRVTTAASVGLAGSDAGAARTLAVLLGVVLPGLVYAFLSGVWLARTLAEMVRLPGR
jgi:hypothetical protein